MEYGRERVKDKLNIEREKRFADAREICKMVASEGDDIERVGSCCGTLASWIENARSG